LPQLKESQILKLKVMRKIIFIFLLSIVIVSCNSGVSCDSDKVKETALSLFETEIIVQLAYDEYYAKVISPIENTAYGQMLQALSQMGGESLNIEDAKIEAINSFRKLANGETVKDTEKYQAYIHYADSIMDLGKTNLEIIMTTADDPKLKKCECEAVLVFDTEIDIEDIDVSYDVQKASDGEVYVTIYMR